MVSGRKRAHRGSQVAVLAPTNQVSRGKESVHASIIMRDKSGVICTDLFFVRPREETVYGTADKRLTAYLGWKTTRSCIYSKYQHNAQSTEIVSGSQTYIDEDVVGWVSV